MENLVAEKVGRWFVYFVVVIVGLYLGNKFFGKKDKREKKEKEKV